MNEVLKKKLSLPFHEDNGEEYFLVIYEELTESLFEVDESEALLNLEVRVQIIEGYSYEYELPENFVLEELSGVVSRFKSRANCGRITPGIYTGTLQLRILSKATSNAVGSVNIEVRSRKIGYRTDYRFMLKEISEKCVDLILQSTSLTNHSVTADASRDSRSLYQQFTFVKSAINSSEFMESVHRILTMPVTRWEHQEVEKDIRRAGRITRSSLRQIASAGNRIALPNTHPLYERLGSISAKLKVIRKHESPDTPENQFVKHVLSTFNQFCGLVRSKLEPNGREYLEALNMERTLEQLLEHSLFKEISDPSMLPLNSPILQRKEGYREVLKTWLTFDLSSKLAWNGGDDVYSAGKRDIATLYEYWLFFKLLDLFKVKFSVDIESFEDLIEKTNDGLGLKLKSGLSTSYLGTYDVGGRKLAVKFSFNRTFSGKSNYPNKGSWTKSMRPDFTLTFWPFGFEETEAEHQELITHIHFDAKYKVTNISEIFNDDVATDDTDKTDNLQQEKIENQKGIYKRADLLKMHAYKDAIRRTSGAYVLYPGTENETNLRGFHEILPGLGAFSIRPNETDDGTFALSSFIDKVIEQLINRASQQEQQSFYTYSVHKNTPPADSKISDVIPEYWPQSKTRIEPLKNVGVLIGYCKGDDHYDWICNNKKYNIRMETIQTEPMFFGAKYLLLHKKDQLVTSELWRIVGVSPDILAKEDMARLGYPSPRDFYLVYSVEKVSHTEFNNMCWDVSKLPAYKSEHQSAKPFAISLESLMRVVCAM